MHVYLISGARQCQDEEILIYMTTNRRKSLFEISINVNTKQGFSLVHPTISRSRNKSSLYFSLYIHIWQALDRLWTSDTDPDTDTDTDTDTRELRWGNIYISITNINQLHTNRGWSLWWAQQSQDRDINPRLRVGDWRPPDDVRDAFICNMTRSYVTWRIHMLHDTFTCQMTRPYVTWIIHMWLIHTWHDSCICDVPHAYVTWLVYMWHDSFTYDWFIRDMTHSYVAWLIHIW